MCVPSQVCGHGFEAGALGPSTIVGSAAFNMFVIIALCVYVVPDGETRKIKHLRVFFVTGAWSIFAYIWLYLILSVFSPGEVAVRTLMKTEADFWKEPEAKMNDVTFFLLLATRSGRPC